MKDSLRSNSAIDAEPWLRFEIEIGPLRGVRFQTRSVGVHASRAEGLNATVYPLADLTPDLPIARPTQLKAWQSPLEKRDALEVLHRRGRGRLRHPASMRTRHPRMGDPCPVVKPRSTEQALCQVRSRENAPKRIEARKGRLK